jgi:phage terminase large subunit-like protein
MKTEEELIWESYTQPKIIGYHVTRQINIPSIKKKGLIPKIPLDYGEIGDIEGVYFFKDKDSVEDALMNWLGERIEEWEEKTGDEYDEVTLVVDLTGMQNSIIEEDDMFEYIVTDIVTPNRIIDILNL